MATGKSAREYINMKLKKTHTGSLSDQSEKFSKKITIKREAESSSAPAILATASETVDVPSAAFYPTSNL